MTKQEETNSEMENTSEEAASNEEVSNEAYPEEAMPDTTVSDLLTKLEETTAEVVAQKERYLRTVADLENYRKRALRDKEDARRQANCGLVEDLLPVLDNFKLGLKSASEMREVPFLLRDSA